MRPFGSSQVVGIKHDHNVLKFRLNGAGDGTQRLRERSSLARRRGTPAPILREKSRPRRG